MDKKYKDILKVIIAIVFSLLMLICFIAFIVYKISMWYCIPTNEIYKTYCITYISQLLSLFKLTGIFIFFIIVIIYPLKYAVNKLYQINETKFT